MYWAVLYKAGYDVNEHSLSRKLSFDPNFKQELRSAIYQEETPPSIDSLANLVSELEKIADLFGIT